MADIRRPFAWPCPKCGSLDTRRDKACRICNACGHRASMEAFAPKVDES